MAYTAEMRLRDQVSMLIRYGSSADDGAHLSALVQLSQMGDAAVPLLAKDAESEAPHAIAVKALGMIATPAAVEALSRTLAAPAAQPAPTAGPRARGGDDAQHRRLAATWLLRIETPEALAAVASSLHLLGEAAHDLYPRLGPAGPALLARFMESGTDAQALAACDLAARHKVAETRDALLDLWCDDDLDLKLAAFRALAALGDAIPEPLDAFGSWAAIARALRIPPAAATKSDLADLLAGIGDVDVVPALVALIAESPHLDAPRRSLVGLGDLAVPELLRVMQEDDEDARQRVAAEMLAEVRLGARSRWHMGSHG